MFSWAGDSVCLRAGGGRDPQEGFGILQGERRSQKGFKALMKPLINTRFCSSPG